MDDNTLLKTTVEICRQYKEKYPGKTIPLQPHTILSVIEAAQEKAASTLDYDQAFLRLSILEEFIDHIMTIVHRSIHSKENDDWHRCPIGVCKDAQGAIKE